MVCFPGYNFPSLASIKPYLERVGAGRTGQWARETARRLNCKVCVGYPEIETTEGKEGEGEEEEKYYNSLLTVDENGEILFNYRKSFLYYTDESWASEGDPDRGSCTLTFGGNDQSPPKRDVPTSFGVCMDINPYRFEAPFTAWEFANRVLDSGSQLVIVSMAWLTLLRREEIVPENPDMDTFDYWIRRFWPLLEKKMKHDSVGDDVDDGGDTMQTKRVVIVFSNRVGEEAGGAEPVPIARYAGSSAIVAFTQSRLPEHRASDPAEVGQAPSFDPKILCWCLCGAAEEGVCFADTTTPPELVWDTNEAVKDTENISEFF